MKVKEVFYTLQGEGRNTGRPAVFCRFVGCNLWSGREQDRATAICKFCDTDFLGGQDYSENGLVEKIASTWGVVGDLDDCAKGVASGGKPLVVFTGGEPGLQLSESLIHRLRRMNFDVAVETNGTIELPNGVYWITMSPKACAPIRQTFGHEIKVVWPQDGINLKDLERLDYRDHYLQPMAGVDGALQATIDTCLKNPKWHLSLQTHKTIGVR
jgi:7-carboxy-7-deazaguanine synthase (Cx14CxxC type)